MDRVLSIPVGIVIAREKIDNPWQEFVWRPVSVFLNAPEIDQWRELRRDAVSVHYHAATMPLELHPKETLGYAANLAEGEPAVYVVLRQRDEDESRPVEIPLATASAYEAQAYGHTDGESVGSVAMPEPLVELLEAYLAEHHVEEKFVKRQRVKYHKAEEHKFGQEPIDVLRERMRRAGVKEDGNE